MAKFQPELEIGFERTEVEMTLNKLPRYFATTAVTRLIRWRHGSTSAELGKFKMADCELEAEIAVERIGVQAATGSIGHFHIFDHAQKGL